MPSVAEKEKEEKLRTTHFGLLVELSENRASPGKLILSEPVFIHEDGDLTFRLRGGSLAFLLAVFA